MKFWKKTLNAVVVLAGISLFSAESRAQDQNDAPPKPAAKVLLPIGVGDEQETDQPIGALEPDDRPLTGFQQLTVGTPPERHSYWIPGISFTNIAQSNALTLGGGNAWNSTSYVTGNLSLQQNWSNSKLALNYSGGRSFSTDAQLGSAQFQQLGAIQTFDWRRWQLTILDQFAYLPIGQFGFGAGTGIAAPGVGGPLAPIQPGLLNQFAPNQGGFTTTGPQYNNSGGTQIAYKLTPRGSFNIGGLFGILRFTKPGNIESNQAMLNAGYNYLLSQSDTLGLSYRFSAYHFINLPQAIGDHVIQVAYGKQITGRLALQLSGGPEIIEFRTPPLAGTETQFIKGSGTANLSYAFSSGGLSLAYIHGLNNGAGAFVGATTDQITGGATRRLSQLWSASVNFGYALNRNAATSAGTQNQAFNSIYAGAGLTRPIGRNTTFTLNYTANIVTSNNTACAGPNCGTNFTTHMVNVTLGWRARPIVLH